MNTFKLEFDDLELVIEIAKTKKDRKKGFSGRDEITGGMLFSFREPGKHQMWMKDTKLPLDILFLNENEVVTEVATGLPEDTALIGSRDDTKFVLEIPAGFATVYNLEEGDGLDIPIEAKNNVEEESEDAPAVLLDDEGNEQMPIKGGERVVSREKTSEIVDLAKGAKTEDDLINLGKFIADEIQAQDGRGPDYVDPDKTKYQYAKHGAMLDTPYDDYLVSLPDAEVKFGNLRRILRMQGFELTRIKTDPTSLF